MCNLFLSMGRFPPSRILVGVSCATEAASLTIAPTDRHAFHEAAWMAKGTGAHLRAFHVTDFVDDRISDGRSSVAELLQDKLRDQMQGMISHAHLERVHATMGFAQGKPWYELLREAHRWKADLIVVSARREAISVGERIFYGSTSRRLLRKAPCPLWTVQQNLEEGESVGVHRVLALVDGAPIAKRVVEVANGIAELAGAKKMAVRSLDYPDDIALRRFADAHESLRAYHADVRREAVEELVRLTGGIENGWEVHLESRWIPDVVAPLVQEHRFDLVVMGATSKKRLAGVLLGTTAEKIIERTPVSTYVVRREGWKSPVQFDG